MKHYETMFIVKPTLAEDEIKQRIDFYKETITKNKGEIETCLDMGMRNLAYDIKKHKRGYYFVIYFKALPGLVLELERLYRINEDILRFIVIKYESHKEQRAWQSLVDRANKKPDTKPKTLKADKTDKEADKDSSANIDTYKDSMLNAREDVKTSTQKQTRVTKVAHSSEEDSGNEDNREKSNSAIKSSDSSES